MKRVLHVITVKPGYEGITMSVMRFLRNMHRVGCDLVLTAEPPAEIKREMLDMGCRVHVIPGRLRRPVRYLFALRRIIKDGGYDIVHAHGNSCTLTIELLAAKLGGARVRAAHSHNTSCKFMLAHKALRKPFDRLCTHAWACGAEAGQWLFPGREFSIARVSTDTSAYAFDGAIREKYRRDMGLDGRFVVGSVANLTEQKNHRFMLEAFAEYFRLNANARLLLVGDGPLRGDIEKQAEELGITGGVMLLGSRGDVPALLQACDVMLLPSLYEGFPGVLVEWQCAGLRALVSDKVTRDTDLTGLLRFLPVDKGAGVWTEALLEEQISSDREAVSAEAICNVREKGYDIAENARKLEDFYLSV